ncbi:hypothetical protein [Microbacterium neungamense]|uniref:hypothetical protein n=1 Tax=Microbacterium neungamense TaxID=2810535 RepID=UPI00217EBC9A|nr:hypothetical protein [Microbacterium neungamense]
MLGVLAVSVTGALPWLVVGAWGLAGAGMGLIYPRLTVLTLAYSTPANEGFHSSALSISDASGSSVAIALGGLVFLALPSAAAGFAGVYLFTAALLLLSLVPGLRMRDGLRVGTRVEDGIRTGDGRR